MRLPVVLACLLAACAFDNAPSPQASRPADRQFSQARLDAITSKFQADVDAGVLPGAVMMVARDGKVVYEQVVGMRDPKTNAPMTKDAIFRIFSMTKPLTSVVAMTLVEEGKLQLSDRVSKYLPEFKGLKVAVEKAGPDGKPILETVAATREVTVQDLLRHTAGLVYPGEYSAVAREYIKAGAVFGEIQSDDDLVKKLSNVPLASQPGQAFQYGFATDVLGALIERVAGAPVDVVMTQRLLEPLKMADTRFWVDSPRRDRVAEPFEPISRRFPLDFSARSPRPTFLNAGGVMVSSAGDYLRFGQMMLNGGELDGVRILSPRAVAFMTSDHLDGAKVADWWFPDGYGFGLGFAVRKEHGAAAMNGSKGDYFWVARGGASFWVDPSERLVAVLMIQGDGLQWNYMRLYRNMVYAALH